MYTPSVLVASRMPPMSCSAKICVNTFRSQMICRIVVIRKIGLRYGKTMSRKRASPPAPSSSDASITSSGTWVNPAYSANATNGTAPQMMTMAATRKKLSGWMSQECWVNCSSPNTFTSTWLITP